MERALIMSGIGGQGIQLASSVLARASVDEGRQVQVFGSYEGMMRGGATESTMVVADESLESPPTIGEAWSAIFMHHEHAGHAAGTLRSGSLAFVNTTVVDNSFHFDVGITIVEVPASELAVSVGHIMAASMVMIGAYIAVTGLVSLESALHASAMMLPAYRAQHRALNEAALTAGFNAVPGISVPAWTASGVGA
jgi:Pyruvate/2-oxoacid:ferredoxin oxidoreductase gamma subunit